MYGEGSSVYGGLFSFGICQDIYDTVLILINGIGECGKTVNAVGPFLFIPVRHRTNFSVGGIIGLIGPYLIRPETAVVCFVRVGIGTAVRASVGKIFFYDSVVVKVEFMMKQMQGTMTCQMKEQYFCVVLWFPIRK